MKYLLIAIVITVGFGRQPILASAAERDAASGNRMWSDATGRFQVAAQFADYENGAVVLNAADGRKITTPFEKLSNTDQSYVRAELRRRALDRVAEISATRRKPSAERETRNNTVTNRLDSNRLDSNRLGGNRLDGKQVQQREKSLQIAGVDWYSRQDASQVAQRFNRPVMWYRVLGDLTGLM